MRMGLLLGRPQTGDASDGRLLREQAALAEANGFDCCLVAEHHAAARSQYYAAPLIGAAWAAAATTTLRIGSGIAILPLLHPRKLAEEAQLLNLLSGGRVVVGVGMGYLPAEFEAFDVPFDERAERFTGGLALLRETLTEEAAASFPGPPPVWVAAWSRTGVRRAGRLGDGWLGDPAAHVGRLAGLAKLYREEDVSGRGTVAVLRDACIAESTREAAERGDDQAEMLRHYWRRGAYRHVTDPWLDRVESEHELPIELARVGRTVFGSPDDCLEALRALHERVCPDLVVLRLPFSRPIPPERARELVKLAGRYLIPEVASWPDEVTRAT